MKTEIKISILIISFLLPSIIFGQTFKLERTDVDSTRSSFVTATYNFGFDVIAEDIENCNGAAFELHFNQTDYVKFNGYDLRGFGEDPIPIVFTEEDPANDISKIHVGVLSGETLEENGFDNPNIIHLEFTVAQSAPNEDDLTFTFVNPQAVVSSDSGVGEVLDIETEPVTYQIHSFIDVWPGDADNNDSVNTKDISQILLFLGMGSNTKFMRSFKRPNASTLWTGQRVLGWDSLTVTYADCDGNGDVTMSDALVVYLNYGKAHGIPIIPVSEGNITENADIIYEPAVEKSENTVSIPVQVGETTSYIAAGAVFDYSLIGNDYNLIGFERGDIFNPGESYFTYNINPANKTASIAFGSLDKNITNNSAGIIAYALLEPNGTTSSKPAFPIITELKGINRSGMVFPLIGITGVNKSSANSKDFTITHLDENIHLSLTNDLPETSELEIFDYTGNKIRNFYLQPELSGNTSIYCPLPSGVYFAILRSSREIKSCQFISN